MDALLEELRILAATYAALGADDDAGEYAQGRADAFAQLAAELNETIAIHERSAE